MLVSSVILLLLAAIGDGAALRLRDDPSPDVRKTLEEAGVDISKRVAKPKNKIEELLSIGDSYSAGIGSNGSPDEWGETNCSRYSGAWPVLLSDMDEWSELGKDGKKPSLTFGPCSGNVMVDVREKMLEQGDAKDTKRMGPGMWPYTPIGKPQIAVMTISGNDINFSGIVNDCVFRYWPKMSCEKRLEDSANILRSPEFKQELRLTYAKVIAAGRKAGGADPPESFQVYGGGYIGLFNHDDHDCDNIYWNVFYGIITHQQFLKTSVRKQFNTLVDELNGVIWSVLQELGPWGAIYVDGYNQGFNNHRFCEHREPKCIHYRAHEDNDMETKIWSYRSFWDEGRHMPVNDGEGPDRHKICHLEKEVAAEEGEAEVLDMHEHILKVVVPDDNERQKMIDDPSLAPWDVSEGNWDAYDDVFEMMRDRMNLHDDPVSVKWIYDWTFRMFHPKKSGYQFFANSWMERIKANRQESDLEDPEDGPEKPLTDGNNQGVCKTSVEGGASKGTTGINMKTIDWEKLKTCFRKLDSNKWMEYGDENNGLGSVTRCDDVIDIVSGRERWESPSHCYLACKNCLSQNMFEGFNQVWCDARDEQDPSYHCWMGLNVPNPGPSTDGTNMWEEMVSKQYQFVEDWFNPWGAQKCLWELPHDNWIRRESPYTCESAPVEFTMQSYVDDSGVELWQSPSACYDATKNCISKAMNEKKTEALCRAEAGEDSPYKCTLYYKIG